MSRSDSVGQTQVTVPDFTVPEDTVLVDSEVDLSAIRALLCDADGNLFPSEEPAFEASAAVVNRLMERIGGPQRFEPEQLRRAGTGKNFRSLAAELAAQQGASLSDAMLEEWVAEEKREVSDRLREVLKPDGEVLEVLTRLSGRYELAAVSSSALSRIDACLAVTGLAPLLPADRRFSAEDSLARPTSKPDPAVYQLACRELELGPDEALAIEDSATGVLSAVRAGLPVIGNLRFVLPEEREAGLEELKSARAFAIVSSWGAVEGLLTRRLTGEGSSRARPAAGERRAGVEPHAGDG